MRIGRVRVAGIYTGKELLVPSVRCGTTATTSYEPSADPSATPPRPSRFDSATETSTLKLPVSRTVSLGSVAEWFGWGLQWRIAGFDLALELT
jgi:hypothetical protein